MTVNQKMSAVRDEKSAVVIHADDRQGIMFTNDKTRRSILGSVLKRGLQETQFRPESDLIVT